MADPVPPVALPECEYIELYNRGNRTVNMKGCVLCIGDHAITMPEFIMEAGACKIICDDSDADLLKNFGAPVTIKMFPPVLNTGQIITLKDSCGSFVHTVCFDPDWYDLDPGGGRSLELIDPENPCGEIGNWLSSKDPSGGTPGSVNSVTGINRDREGPLLLRATLPSESDVQLHFNEPLHPSDLTNVSCYSVNNNLFHPDFVVKPQQDFSKITLHYEETFHGGTVYSVSILNRLQDCAGNAIRENAFAEFAVPERCMPSDIIINEILFDGSENTVEFIEIFNRSSKTIDLSTTSLSLADVSTGQPEKIIRLKNYPFLLLPGNYVVITGSRYHFTKAYQECPPSAILEITGFPVLPDKEGMIVMTDTAGQVLDEIHYSYKMHLDLLNDDEGISLEKIDPVKPSSDPDNWMSASSIQGYATPGRKNSQHTSAGSELTLTVSPEFISPDGDGIDDLVTLRLTGVMPGWIGSILIYDTEGRIIRTLFNHSLVGTDEYFTWDGKNQEGMTVNTGFYIVYGELFSQQGTTKNFKKVIPVIKK